MTDQEKIQLLRAALKDAKEHLEYCGYGDRWERECAWEMELPKQLDEALKATES